jgi:NADH-quinone oxidoreductase subunit N
LSAYAGLWREQPALALVLAFALVCLAGLPPGVMGVVAKIVALVPVIGVEAWGLVAVAVVNVVLGVAVYLRWAVHVFSPRSDGEVVRGRPTPLAGRLALSLAAAGCVALSVLPEGLIGLLGGAALR